MIRRLLPLLLVALATLGLAACGDKPATIAKGESEAEYVTLGKLQYQVQISRQLNPAEVGDRDNLVGLAPADRAITGKQVWFGVWIRVFNKSGKPQRSAETFKIVDTRGREYLPVVQASVNRVAYRPETVADQSQLPQPGSLADGSSTSGALLLFKLDVDALDFRPLEFAFSSSELGAAESTIRLDV